MITPENELAALCRDAGLDKPFAEFRFHPKRLWRFDLAWPAHKLAVEIEGGAFSRGRHVRGAGFVKDLEKYNEATALGWRILRFTPQLAPTQAAVELIKRVMQWSN